MATYTPSVSFLTHILSVVLFGVKNNSIHPAEEKKLDLVFFGGV